MRIICLLFCLLFYCNSFAQRGVNQNLKGFDENKKFHFGFLVGANFMNNRLRMNSSLFTEDTILSLNVNPAPGFTLGVITDLHLGSYFDLRAIFPTLVFGQRDFQYLIPTKDGLFLETRVSESTYLAIPIELKYKSERYGNWRTYITGGGFAGYDMVSQKDTEEGVPVVRLERWDYGFSLGFGFEFFLEYFKFSPHIKWDQGLRNLMLQDGTPFTSVIDGLRSQTFSISLTFEG